MSPIEQITQRNQYSFMVTSLQHELNLLKKETKHLREKHKERELTSWEMDRISVISVELLEIVKQIKNPFIQSPC